MLNRSSIEAKRVWLEIFKYLKLWCLRSSISDHCPLLISCEAIDWGPKPFRSLDTWFSNPNFMKLTANEWKSLENMPLHEKLKNLKAPIKKWNKDVFGSIDNRIGELEAEIKKPYVLSNNQNLNDVEVARRNALNAQL